MIGNDSNKSMYDAVVLKVCNRWYICSEAIFSDIKPYGFLYEYKTPTLKFILDDNVGYVQLEYNKSCIEIMGIDRSLKLEYL